MFRGTCTTGAFYSECKLLEQAITVLFLFSVSRYLRIPSIVVQLSGEQASTNVRKAPIRVRQRNENSRLVSGGHRRARREMLTPELAEGCLGPAVPRAPLSRSHRPMQGTPGSQILSVRHNHFWEVSAHPPAA